MRTPVFAVLLLASLLAAPARADEGDDVGRLAAVQKREQRMAHEIFGAAQFMPLDAFYKGIGPSVGYAYHFTDLYAWEILRGGYSFRIKTGLDTDLQKKWQVTPTRFEELEWMMGTAAMFSPMFGKIAFSNGSVSNIELFFILGASLGKFNDSWKPGPQGGLGLRFFLGRLVSLRFECRYHYMISARPTQVLDVALGLAINLGGATK